MSLDWDSIDAEGLLPENKKYSIVKLDSFKPPTDDDAAVNMYEVDDLEEAKGSTPEPEGVAWIAYDEEGNSYSV